MTQNPGISLLTDQPVPTNGESKLLCMSRTVALTSHDNRLAALLNIFKPRPNALDFSLYIARQLSSIVERCREGVAKRSRLFTQHACRALYSEKSRAFGQGFSVDG